MHHEGVEDQIVNARIRWTRSTISGRMKYSIDIDAMKNPSLVYVYFMLLPYMYILWLNRIIIMFMCMQYRAR